MSDVLTRFGILGIAANGTAQGQAILFLHGVGSTKEVWQPQLNYFKNKRTAIAIDYPGYDESELLADANRDDFARAAFAALDAMGRERAHICGLSLGGVVAIAMHALAPSRCLSLILADTFAQHPEGEAIYKKSIVGSEDMGAMAAARTPVLLAGGASQALHDDVRTSMSRIDPAAFRIGAEAVWLADQRDRVAQIEVPTLVLVGDQDTITPPELSQQLADAIPGAQLHIIPGAGHLTNIERPDEFNALVESFIHGVEAQV